MEKTTLYVPKELQRALREEAKRSRRPQAAVIREALGSYLSRRRRPRPASIGAGDDRELAARESERWLRRNWGRR